MRVFSASTSVQTACSRAFIRKPFVSTSCTRPAMQSIDSAPMAVNTVLAQAIDWLQPTARIEKIDTIICGQRPVVVLATAIDAGKGLFMEQRPQSMLLRRLFEDFHQ